MYRSDLIYTIWLFLINSEGLPSIDRDERARASRFMVNKKLFALCELTPGGQVDEKRFFESTFFERKTTMSPNKTSPSAFRVDGERSIGW